MARSQLTDPLQTTMFHLLDVSFSLPVVLIPVFGFARVTLPTIALGERVINEGNYEYPRKVIERATVSNMTLEQGVTLFNSDFSDWIEDAVQGKVEPRTLLLVQFQRTNPLRSAGQGLSGLGFNAVGQAFQDGAVRLPGRAWMCKRCRPVSYRPGSDLDAMSAEISVASLEISMEEFEEINLGV